MKLNNQFYGIIPPKEFPAPKYIKRAFCACVDKGRYEELSEIRKLLIKYNVICDFILVKEKIRTINSSIPRGLGTRGFHIVNLSKEP